jgi:hypothetical protein
MSPQCRPPADLATFRRVLGSFCSGVTVAARGREGPLGLTCRAFASLSHDPPLDPNQPVPSVDNLAEDQADRPVPHQHPEEGCGG